MNPNMKTETYRGRTIDAMTQAVGDESRWEAFVSGAIVSHRALGTADEALAYARDWIDRTQVDPDVTELKAENKLLDELATKRAKRIEELEFEVKAFRDLIGEASTALMGSNEWELYELGKKLRRYDNAETN